MGKGFRQRIADFIAPRSRQSPSQGKRHFSGQVSGFSGTGVPVDDSARTTRGNQRHWGRAGGEDANTLIEAQLFTQRNRSRFEIRNNGFAAGMVHTYANDTVGKDGPRVQVVSDDDEFNDQLERCIGESFEVIGANGDAMADLLLMNIHQLFESGEYIEQEVTDESARTCSTLRLLPIEPDRLQTPFERFADPSFRMGIEVDPVTGKPLVYHILQQHPGAFGTGFKFHKFDERDAAFIIHGFQRKRPGQTRGVPWLAPVLDTFGQLRDFMADTLLAAYIATKFAVLIMTNVDNVDLDDLDGELPIWDLEGGSAAFLPEGWDAKSFNPSVPRTNHVEFVKQILREMGRPIGMPYLKLAADASGHNFSSARLDLQNYWTNVQCTRGMIERTKLNRVARKIMAEATLSREVKQPPATGVRFTWIWNPIPQIDPLKEAKAQTERMRNGTSTLARESRMTGGDWQEDQQQQSRENKSAAELDLPLPHREQGGQRTDLSTMISDAISELDEARGNEDVTMQRMAAGALAGANGNGGQA